MVEDHRDRVYDLPNRLALRAFCVEASDEVGKWWPSTVRAVLVRSSLLETV